MEISRAYSTHSRDEKYIQNLAGEFQVKNYSVDLGVDRRIILE
jgi:hypothetical protein